MYIHRLTISPEADKAPPIVETSAFDLSFFACSITQLASSYMAKCQMRDSKLHKETPSNTAGILNCMSSTIFVLIQLHEGSWLLVNSIPDRSCFQNNYFIFL